MKSVSSESALKADGAGAFVAWQHDAEEDAADREAQSRKVHTRPTARPR